jgi:hypothetical protein
MPPVAVFPSRRVAGSTRASIRWRGIAECSASADRADALKQPQRPALPCVVASRRAPSNGLDDDNLVGALKPARDAAAARSAPMMASARQCAIGTRRARSPLVVSDLIPSRRHRVSRCRSMVGMSALAQHRSQRRAPHRGMVRASSRPPNRGQAHSDCGASSSTHTSQRYGYTRPPTRPCNCRSHTSMQRQPRDDRYAVTGIIGPGALPTPSRWVQQGAASGSAVQRASVISSAIADQRAADADLGSGARTRGRCLTSSLRRSGHRHDHASR